MIRVLQVVNIMNRAGLESMLMNYYRAIDKNKIQFDFLTHRPEKGAFDDEIKSLGGRVFYAPRLYPQNYWDYFKYMKKFFIEHPEYKIVHSHIDAMSYLPLLAAKKSGIPIRIAHSHSTSLDKDFKYLLKMYFKKRIPRVATNYAACTRAAGDYLFPNQQVTQIANAISIEKFYYNEKIRGIKRSELNIENNFVIGHVGRFTKAKNHQFIIELFYEIVKENPEVKLLLVGNGELKEEICKKISDYGIEKNVVILSDRDDVNELYQVMDIYIFPSLYEGLGMSAIEAQVSGLKCYLSSSVPDDAIISDNAEFIDLNINEWKKAILNTMRLDKKDSRCTVYSDYYNVNEAAKNLLNFYEGLQNK